MQLHEAQSRYQSALEKFRRKHKGWFRAYDTYEYSVSGSRASRPRVKLVQIPRKFPREKKRLWEQISLGYFELHHGRL